MNTSEEQKFALKMRLLRKKIILNHKKANAVSLAQLESEKQNLIKTYISKKHGKNVLPIFS